MNCCYPKHPRNGPVNLENPAVWFHKGLKILYKVMAEVEIAASEETFLQH